MGGEKNKKKKKRFAAVSRVCAKSLTIESRSRGWSMSRQAIHRLRRFHSRPLFANFVSLIAGMDETVCLENSMSVDGSSEDYRYVEESMGGSDEFECLSKTSSRETLRRINTHVLRKRTSLKYITSSRSYIDCMRCDPEYSQDQHHQHPSDAHPLILHFSAGHTTNCRSHGEKSQASICCCSDGRGYESRQCG